MNSGTCTGSAGFGLSSVSLNGINRSSNCYGSSNTDVYRYWSNTTTLTGGNAYAIEIVPQASTLGILVSGGFWIDYDQDSTFDSVELVNAVIGNNYGSLKFRFNFTVPCNAKTGVTRLRVRTQGYSLVKGNHSCSAAMNYGETWDFNVTIAQPTGASAGFIVPDTMFVKEPVKFENVNRTGYVNHEWDANNDATIDAANALDFVYSWATTGTKCVKLKSTNCFGSDTLVKCVTIIAPTAKPVVKIKNLCNRVIEQYEVVQLFDESTNGPWEWTWDVIDSINFAGLWDGTVIADPWNTGNDEFSKNPQFEFDVPGIYQILLKVKNDIGGSQAIFKGVVKVIPPTLYTLGYGTYGKKGDNVVSSNYGTICDNGGPNLNYGVSQGVHTRSYLTITPDNATPITLKFSQLRFADASDMLKIYDDDYANPSKLIASLSSSDNGTYPSYTSTTNKMYIVFTSNASGTDSGYFARYYTDGYGGLSSPSKELGHNVLQTNKVAMIYGKFQSREMDNFNKKWKIDGVHQKLFDGLDTLKHVFTDTTNHTVCVELSNCDTVFSKCIRLFFDRGIMGSTYKDINSNCTYDNGDAAMGNIRVKLFDRNNNLLGNYVSSNGDYNFNLDTGKYKVFIDTLNLPYKVVCPYPGIDSTVLLTPSNTLAQDVDFQVQCKNIFDVGVQSTVVRGAVFPGKQHTVKVLAGDLTRWYGLNCAINKSGTVKIKVTGPVSYVGKAANSLTPSVSGNVYTYTVSDFASVNIFKDFGLVFNTDTSAQAGDTIRVEVEVTPVSGDGDTANNRNIYYYLARNSYDPNMKEVYPVDVPPFYSDWFTYTIHFQNTGNAPAYNIRLADTLDPQLDLSTFEVLNYSHTMSSSVKGSAVSFKFPNIMLSDSFSDEKGSHGFVQYRIKPKKGLTEGAKIRNTAYIYFDYNVPVVTNTTVNEYVDKTNSIKKIHGSNLMKLYPNPNNGSFSIELAARFEHVQCRMEICNVLGEVVYSSTIGNASAKVDMSSLAPGVYLVKVNGNGAQMSASIIKY